MMSEGTTQISVHFATEPIIQTK
uniref:Uncharacterized protein n=1 Tax=Rhizophora mucronata TaxID=61149 RepID=A0A2P2NVI1_RHIMU